MTVHPTGRDGALPYGLPKRLRRVRRVAFFDVDETLLAGKSMLGFWGHWSRGRALPALPAEREERNRAYYRCFAGAPRADFLRAARKWYAQHRAGGAVFVPAAVAELERHRRSGHGVVLVSGSARDLVTPVARDLGADGVVCTEQLTDAEGALTGEVVLPMIGGAKADAVDAVRTELGLSVADCYGYGDHSSDLAMLERTGHAVVVGSDPVATAAALRRGWRILPGPGQ